MTPESCIHQLVQLLLKVPNADDDLLFKHLIVKGCETKMARYAVQLTPIAFGRHLLSGMGITFSDSFLECSPNGDLLDEQQLSQNIVFTTCTKIVPTLWTKEVANNIALRSSEVAAVNNALNNGSKPENLKMAPVILFSDPPTELGWQISQKLLQHRLSHSPNTKGSQQKPWWRFW